MKNFTDKNGVSVTPKTLTDAIDFSNSEYDVILAVPGNGDLRTFSKFIDECVKITKNQDGTFEDAVFLTNSAYKDLCKKYLHNDKEED